MLVSQKKKYQQKKFRILSVDGGGMRLILTVEILKYIEQKTGKRISELFDLIAGTSAGSFVALGLTKPNPSTANEVQKMFVDEGKIIFPKPSKTKRFFEGALIGTLLGTIFTTVIFDPRKSKLKKLGISAIFGGILGGITNYFSEPIRALFRPKYTSAGREKVLKKCLGSTTTISEAVCEVLIATHQTKNNETIFITKELAKKQPQWNCELWRAAFLSSAAPTYFALAKYYNNTYIDGGVAYNNPTMPSYQYARKELGIKKDNIVIVSLGSGHSEEDLGFETNNINMGLLHWVLKTRILTMMLKGVGPRADNKMKAKKLQHYYRIDTFLKDEIGLDATEPKNIEKLQSQGKKLAEKNKELLNKKIIPLLMDKSF